MLIANWIASSRNEMVRFHMTENRMYRKKPEFVFYVKTDVSPPNGVMQFHEDTLNRFIVIERTQLVTELLITNLKGT